LTSYLIFLVFLLIMGENYFRRRRRFVSGDRGQKNLDRIYLKGIKGWLVTLYCLMILVISLGIPLLQLGFWAFKDFSSFWSAPLDFFDYLNRTMILSFLASLITCFICIFLCYSGRKHSDLLTQTGLKISLMGYALPGTILAVGVYSCILWLDKTPSGFIIFSGLLLAYVIRFMAAAFNPVDSSLQRVTPALDESARSLQAGKLRIFFHIHFPFIRAGLLTSLLLVFVDVMKEMPITLMVRPFGWDTLAVKIYELTSEGEWQRAALPAMLLVGAGLLPVYFLFKFTENLEQKPV